MKFNIILEILKKKIYIYILIDCALRNKEHYSNLLTVTTVELAYTSNNINFLLSLFFHWFKEKDQSFFRDGTIGIIYITASASGNLKKLKKLFNEWLTMFI